MEGSLDVGQGRETPQPQDKVFPHMFCVPCRVCRAQVSIRVPFTNYVTACFGADPPTVNLYLCLWVEELSIIYGDRDDDETDDKDDHTVVNKVGNQVRQDLSFLPEVHYLLLAAETWESDPTPTP